MKCNNVDIIIAALDRSLKREDAAIGKYIDKLEAPSDEFFARLDKAAKDIISSLKRTFSLRKVISAIAVAALLICMMALSISASRGVIKGFFVEFFDGFALLKPNEDVGANHDITVEKVSIGYIPDNFKENRAKVSDASSHHEWVLEDKFISLMCNVNINSHGHLDTDDSDATEIIVGDKSVWRTDKFGQLCAMWTDGKVVYILTSSGLGWDEMVKIIEGISYKDD